MIKTISPYRKLHPRNSGQALVLIAITFVVLLAFVGLAMDVGQLFIAHGSLRRATDAGALAAAAQYRENHDINRLEAAAREAISLNGINPDTVIVEICDLNDPDPDLCPPSGGFKRKLVRVTASAEVPMSFLSIIGFHNFPINTTAISEAASMDVVLVIDTSESMAFDAPPGNPLRDPAYCNNGDGNSIADPPGECQPFQRVKQSAIGFVQRILDQPPELEEDRLAIVTFADGYSADLDLGTHFRPDGNPRWINDVAEAVNIILNLKVYEPGICASNIWRPDAGTMYGPCRNYSEAGEYLGLYCDYCIAGPEPYNNESWNTSEPINDWSPYMTTNIGGGLRKGAAMFGHETREDTLWILILLTDGLANATDLETGDNLTDIYTYPIGFCPDWRNLCQDNDTTTRHSASNDLYDADDYARDMADFAACAPLNPHPDCATEGQGAIIFTIGLGDEVINTYSGTPSEEVNNIPYGAALLRYIARVGVVGNPSAENDPCAGVSDYTRWCGNYYYSPGGNELFLVFEDIASRIFTRIIH
jgi:hypothetical protein